MRADDNLLVMCDQFEEIFRFARGDGPASANAAAFVKLLLEAASQTGVPVYVVLTMRSEYLGQCAQFRDLPETLNDTQYLVPRMTRDERRAAIEGPVAIGGATIAPRLVQRLLNEVGDDEYRLPVLQHALMRTYERWRASGRELDPIDFEHYEAVGGLARALSNHADEVFSELPDDSSRDVARRVFQCLTEKLPGTPETRRPTPFRDLCAITGADERSVRSVVDVFRGGGRTFLTPSFPQPIEPDMVVDITHESLIRLWDRLRLWAEEEGESVRWYKRLAADSQAFKRREQSPWMNPQLQFALDYSRRTPWTEPWAERYDPGGFGQTMAFLEASRRGHFRRLGSRAVFGIVVLAALVAAAMLLQTRSESSLLRKANEELAKKTGELEAATVKLGDQTRELSAANTTLEQQRKTLAEQAEGQQQTLIELDKQLVLNEERRQREVTQATARRLSTQALLLEAQRADDTSAGGESLLAGIPDTSSRPPAADVRVLLALEAMKRDPSLENDQVLRQILRSVPAIFARVDGATRLAFSADGRYIAVVGKSVSGFDARTRQPVWHDKQGRCAAFTPDGRVAIGDEGVVRFIDAASGKELSRVPITGTVNHLGLSQSGKLLLVATERDGLIALEPQTGAERWRHDGKFLDIAISPDSRYIAAVDEERTLVFDVATGENKGSLPEAKGIRSIASSANSRALAAGDNTALRIFDVEGGAQLVARLRQQDAVVAVSAGLSSDEFFTAHRSGVVRALTDDRQSLRFQQAAPIQALAVSRDGQRIATVGQDGYIRLISFQAARLMQPEEPIVKSGIYDMAFTPDGRWLAVGYFNRAIAVVYDVAEGRESWRTRIIGQVRALAIAPNGRAVAADTGVIARPGGIIVQLTPAPRRDSPMAFAANGRIVTTASGQHYDAITGRPVTILGGGKANLRVLSDDGRYGITINRIVTLPTVTPVMTPQTVDQWTSLAVSDDGYVALGSSIVRVYERSTGRQVLSLGPQRGRVLALAFTRDGRRLIEASAPTGFQSVVREHLLRAEDLIAEGCSRLLRNLDPKQEWPNYLQEPYRPTCPALPVP
jgi:WD40 repeat protein